MFSTSKNSALNANASDGGILTFGGIAPLTINYGPGDGSKLNVNGLLVLAIGIGGALLGLWLLLRK
jgi:hypothetical protein